MSRRIFKESNIVMKLIGNLKESPKQQEMNHYLGIDYFCAFKRINLENWKIIYTFFKNVYCEKNSEIETLINEFKIFGEFNIKILCSSDNKKNTFLLEYIDKNLIIYFCGNRLFLYSETEIDEQTLDKICKPFEPRKDQGIYVIASNADGLELILAGSVNEPLIKENYPNKIQTQIEKSIEWVQTKNPYGRITIMSGPRGTGKSFAIRAMVTETKNVHWILVPSDIAGQLANPNFITTLLSERFSEKSIALIIEDGDNLIRKRNSNNEDVVSQILNFGDGLIGDIIDLKLIITTNKSLYDIDDAITRPGRLHDIIEFTELDKDQSNAIYERLTGEKNKYTEGKFLAYIYEDYMRKEAEKVRLPEPERLGQYI